MSECKCDLRTKLVGDGCRYCNPQEYIDHLHDALKEREWVSLTDEEIEAVNYIDMVREDYEVFSINQGSVLDFARAIEAKLKEKNT